MTTMKKYPVRRVDSTDIVTHAREGKFVEPVGKTYARNDSTHFVVEFGVSLTERSSFWCRLMCRS